MDSDLLIKAVRNEQLANRLRVEQENTFYLLMVKRLKELFKD